MQLESETGRENTPDSSEYPEGKSGLGAGLRTDTRLRRRAKWLAGGGAILVLAALAVTYRYYSIRESTDDAQIDGHVDPISARIGGTVAAVKIEENQHVQKGALLVQLDPTDYRVALDRARANLAEAEAAAKAAQTEVPVTSTATINQISSSQAMLARAQAGVLVAAREVDSARARLSLSSAKVREAEATYTKASQDLERMKLLIAKDEISRLQFDDAVAAADTARAVRDSAQAAVEEAEKAVEAAEARLTQSRESVPEAQAALATARTAPQRTAIQRDRAASAAARVSIARSEVEKARLNLDYTSLSAPVSGIISEKNVEVGQVIQAGQPLFAIVPLGDIWVKANFKENQLKNMRPGQKVEISVDAYGRVYNGYIESVAAVTGARVSLLPPENATGNYVKVVQRVPVRIRFDKGQDPEHLLRPGMSVEPTVITR
ncbi:MAG TPA: HlyD family secretion protein [Acidobacteriota bacterium]|nr:HlyD family secretion protein [Acidobacteriota bacterium]